MPPKKKPAKKKPAEMAELPFVPAEEVHGQLPKFQPDELWWSTLIGRIADGNVVPVLGSGLLRIQDTADSTKSLCFFSQLSEGLAKKWGLPFDPQDKKGRQVLHELVLAYHQAGRKSGGNQEQLNIEKAYRDIAEASVKLKFPVSPVLEHLAKVGGFRTFLTTMFDDGVFRALSAANRPARKGVFAPEFPSKLGPTKSRLSDLGIHTDLSQSILDVERDPESNSDCQVYHLLGASEIASPYSYVIWDNDLLNWVMALDDDCKRKPVLESCLRQKYLLFLGLECGHWLTRFILRIANRGPLETEGTPNYFADHGLTRNTLMLQFFESLGPGRLSALELGEGGVEWFAEELSRRWEAYLTHQDEIFPERKASCVLPSHAPPKRKFVFISYSRQHDLEIAKEIKGKLDSLGIDSWFDLKETPFGEQWRTKMEDGIGRCRFFLAIISKEALAERESYYYAEWNLADQRALKFGRDEPFCLTLLVGDADPDHRKIPPSLKSPTRWQEKRGGRWDAFVKAIRRLWEADGT